MGISGAPWPCWVLGDLTLWEPRLRSLPPVAPHWTPGESGLVNKPGAQGLPEGSTEKAPAPAVAEAVSQWSAPRNLRTLGSRCAKWQR